MRGYQLLIYFLLGFLSFGCNDDTQEVKVRSYFDLKGYINGEVTRLEKDQVMLHKSIRRDGKSETRELSAIKWNEELKPFSECDLNKPAWLAAYKADTTQQEDTVYIRYETESEKLPVHSMRIELVSGKLSAIDIITQKENNFYRSHQTLHYDPRVGYDIHGEQKVILADETRYLIRGDFRR